MSEKKYCGYQYLNAIHDQCLINLITNLTEKQMIIKLKLE